MMRDPIDFALMMVRTATPTGSSAASSRGYPGDHPPGAADRRAARRACRALSARAPAHPEGPAVLLRRHDGQHRADRRGAGRDRRAWRPTRRGSSTSSRRSRCWRSRASARCATRSPSASPRRCRSSGRGGPSSSSTARCTSRRPWSRRSSQRGLPALADPGRRQRPHLPGPGGRQHRLPDGAAPGRAEVDRADPDGHAAPGERAARTASTAAEIVNLAAISAVAAEPDNVTPEVRAALIGKR